ncbi:hypothetical protein rsdtw13_35800 [Clostridium sp. TW13]|uniref:Uncharacterized protein n=1 Tax=Inconstantimicrobium mannanitabidum TaxID=1604901 RepID=A0ACB5RGW1_9CLOT|nr:hypothetical protein rsdtw13_35800 [Clostridium sp. TW13]
MVELFISYMFICVKICLVAKRCVKNSTQTSLNFTKNFSKKVLTQNTFDDKINKSPNGDKIKQDDL